MRKSNRTLILDSAFRVIQRDGVRAMTFESVANESGLTKGGLQYHFPSREALLEALHERFAERWTTVLTDLLGKQPAEGTAQERLAAYVSSSSKAATRAELLLLLETIDDPDLAVPWRHLLETWAPPPPKASDGDEALDDFIVRLAADGLWLYEAMAAPPLSPALRRRITARIIAKAQSDR